jgi:hypothetical protein
MVRLISIRDWLSGETTSVASGCLAYSRANFTEPLLSAQDFVHATLRVEVFRRTSQVTRKSTQEAWNEFLADIEARKLNDSTARKYKLLNRQMEEFAQRRGLRVLADFDLSKVSQFRSEWKDGPRSSAKKLERLRALFRFAQKRKWVAENPALDLKAPKITLCPTLPFGREEMVRILAAVD